MKIIISGYGRMGHMIESRLKERGITPEACSEDICATPAELAGECVCIDFTTPDAFRANYKFIAANFKAAVIGTTGWSKSPYKSIPSKYLKVNTPFFLFNEALLNL